VNPLCIPSIDDVKKLRKRLGLTQSEVAKLAGVSQSLVSQIESGEVDPRLSTLKRIIETLNEEGREREVYAEDIYISNLIYVSPEDMVADAANVMWTNYISQLPVIDHGKNVGSISEKVITEEIAGGSSRELVDKTVGDIMRDPFPMIGKKTRMEVIISLLQDNLAVLVMERGKIVGIITNTDVMTRLKNETSNLAQ
jgi:predicted transcriptional regulator